MTTQEAYLHLHNESGIKVGDTVKVLRKAKDEEMGWDDHWSDAYMDSTIGIEGMVKEDNKAGGFCVTTKEGYYNYPFFVLELVKSGPKIIRVTGVGDYEAIVSDKDVTVDRTVISHAKVLEIAEAIKKMKE